MGNHHKEIKKKAAKKRLQEESIMSRYGLRFDDTMMAVGIILECVSVSQVAYFAIQQTDAFCRACVGLDVPLFSQTMSRPCIQPICPLYDTPRMTDWTDALIATSTSTCLEALATRSSVIIHYVWWPDFLDRRDLDHAEIARAFTDPRVTVVVRGEDYRELIETEFGIQVIGEAIPDFNLDQLFGILLPLMRGRENV